MRLLIVEDEVSLAKALAKLLEKEKYTVDCYHDGTEGYYAAVSGIYDLVILDIMLPGMSGLDILRRLRNEGKAVPILMLTARAQVEDKIQGLDAGADDYLPKPFDMAELQARVRALLRRRDAPLVQEGLLYGDLSLDLGTLALRGPDKEITLTAKEYELLDYLVQRKGMITSKDQIIQKIWGFEGEAADNNVEVYISFLRKKLSYLDSRVKIKTTRGLGYSLEGGE